MYLCIFRSLAVQQFNVYLHLNRYNCIVYRCAFQYTQSRDISLFFAIIWSIKTKNRFTIVNFSQIERETIIKFTLTTTNQLADIERAVKSCCECCCFVCEYRYFLSCICCLKVNELQIPSRGRVFHLSVRELSLDNVPCLYPSLWDSCCQETCKNNTTFEWSNCLVHIANYNDKTRKIFHFTFWNIKCHVCVFWNLHVFCQDSRKPRTSQKLNGK